MNEVKINYYLFLTVLLYSLSCFIPYFYTDFQEKTNKQKFPQKEAISIYLHILVYLFILAVVDKAILGRCS